jgi:hypothetical protein
MSSRRSVLVAAVAATVSAAIGERAAAALPTCDMEAVVKAAQIDPRRADTTITAGSKASVLLVENALVAKGLLASTYVDGHFGTKTVEAYAAYQRSLGYTGIDASGLPGPTSIKLLGDQRYTVVKSISAGSRVTFRGVTLNTRTKTMLLEAERLLGRQLVLSQGSYNPGGDPSSAGTHDGGGVMDVSVDGMTSATRIDVARKLRTVGFAAWVRNPSQGDWPYHIHAVALADTDQSTQAQHQSGDYYLGMNGLANRAPDDGPVVMPKVTWEEYQRSL